MQRGHDVTAQCIAYQPYHSKSQNRVKLVLDCRLSSLLCSQTQNACNKIILLTVYHRHSPLASDDYHLSVSIDFRILNLHFIIFM